MKLKDFHKEIKKMCKFCKECDPSCTCNILKKCIENEKFSVFASNEIAINA